MKVTSQSGKNRVRIEFEHGNAEGQAEWVFRRMLTVPRDHRDAFLKRERKWEAAKYDSGVVKKPLDKWSKILHLRGGNVRLARLMEDALAALEKAGRERDAKHLARQLGYPFVPWHASRGTESDDRG